MELRLLTYLSPGLPGAIFEALVDHLGRALPDHSFSLRSEERVSGPERGSLDPFSCGDADVGFLCAPSYAWLREREPPPVQLLCVAPVFGDRRNGGRPVYFCDVVVPRRSSARSFEDLRGGVWAYNDPSSLSGYHGLLARLRSAGEADAFFGRVVRSGSHGASVRLLLAGEADAASVDSNVLGIMRERRPALREELRVILSWGPFPVQPVVVRVDLDPHLKDALRACLLDTRADPVTRRALAAFGLTRFAPVSEEDYAAERLRSPGARSSVRLQSR